MQPQPTNARYAGGLLILLGFLLGAGIGITRNEPSVGAIVGTLIGAAVALALWLSARRGKR